MGRGEGHPVLFRTREKSVLRKPKIVHLVGYLSQSLTLRVVIGWPERTFSDTYPMSLIFKNADSDVARRLIQLIPLETLKKEYAVKGASPKVYDDIVARHTVDDLKEDALRLFGHCRQHIYFFRHTATPGKHDRVFLDGNVECQNLSLATAEQLEIEYLLNLQLKFIEVNNQTALHREVRYWWPVKILLHRNILQVRLVIMEMSQRSKNGLHFDGRNLDDQEIVDLVTNSLRRYSPVEALDLNKGIKYLWDNDIVDGLHVAHKKAKSAEVSSMDTGFTFKKQYPTQYKGIIAEPLTKTAFVVLDKGIALQLPNGFAAEPTRGYLAFHRLQDDPCAVERLVKLILDNN